MESNMGHWDRFFRAAFVALAVGLGWGIRGDFGHVLGAMYPGAALGLAFAFVTGQRSMFKWAPLLGALGALFISAGGRMSYGMLHGYAKADTFINFSYGFFTLLLQGGAWGAFGCAIIGLFFDRNRMRVSDWAAAAATVFASGWLFYHLVVSIIGFDINPGRSNTAIAFTGGVIGLFLWLSLNQRAYGFKGALLGYIGFGMGMAGGRFLANASYLQPFPVNHWNIMEVMCGVIGGFVFTYGMLGKRFPDPPDDEPYPLLNIYSMFFVLGLIPLLHRINRIPAGEKLEEWAGRLEGYGYADPAGLSEWVLIGLNTVCVLGFVGAGVWLFLYMRDQHRFAALPVLWLSGVMVLVQNLNALYFFYPRQEGSINMHFVFWIMLALMLLYAAVWKPRDVTDSDDAAEHINWGKWAAGALGAFVLIIVLAVFVNGEETMASANMRWPQWSWREGEPPDRGLFW